MTKEEYSKLFALVKNMSDQMDPLRNIEPITFDQWWRIFMEKFTRVRVRPSTVVKYEVARKHSEELAERFLVDISTEDIQSVLNKLILEHKYRSAEIAKGCLSMCFKSAIENRKAIRNPTTGTSVPVNYPKRKVVVLDDSRKNALLTHCHTPSTTERLTAIQQVYKDILLFVFDTGVRRAEAVDVCWDDWDGGETILIRGTKTKNAKRVIYLAPSTIAMLNRRRNNRANGALIFLSNSGTPLSPRNVLRYSKREMGTTVQSLRHTYATDAAKNNTSPKCLQDHMGHACFSTTFKHYVHHNHEDMRDMVRLTRPCHS